MSVDELRARVRRADFRHRVDAARNAANREALSKAMGSLGKRLAELERSAWLRGKAR